MKTEATKVLLVVVYERFLYLVVVVLVRPLILVTDTLYMWERVRQVERTRCQDGMYSSLPSWFPVLMPCLL